MINSMLKGCIVLGLVVAMSISLHAEQFSTALFTKDVLKSKIQEYLQNQFGTIEQLDITISFKNPEIFKSIPSESTYVHIDFSKPETFLGKILLDIVYLSEENAILEQKKCFVETEVMGTIYVAARKLRTHEIISKNDIEKKRVPFNRQSHRYLASKDKIIGKQVKRTMMKGIGFSDQWVEVVPIINKGQYVKLMLQSPGYEIKYNAIALDSGMNGDTIRVKTDNKKILRGEILDEKSVRMLGY